MAGFDESLSELERGAGPGDGSPGESGGRTGGEEPRSVAGVRERFGDAVLHFEMQAGDEPVVFIGRDRLVEVLTWLKTDDTQRYHLLQDLTAVDHGGGRPLQVVYQLYSLTGRLQLRVKTELGLDSLEVDSVVGLWATADWLEREVYDMFGVHFRGHPDLRRILMPDNYAEGHPLRKDFPLRGRFSRAEQTRRALELDLEDYYTPVELEIGGKRREAAAREAVAEEHRVMQQAGPPPHGVDPEAPGPAGVVVTPSDVVDNPAESPPAAAGGAAEGEDPRPGRGGA